MFIRHILNVLDTVHDIIMASIPGRHMKNIALYSSPEVIVKSHNNTITSPNK